TSATNPTITSFSRTRSTFLQLNRVHPLRLCRNRASRDHRTDLASTPISFYWSLLAPSRRSLSRHRAASILRLQRAPFVSCSMAVATWSPGLLRIQLESQARIFAKPLYATASRVAKVHLTIVGGCRESL